MPQGNFKKYLAQVGDLVTYRSIRELAEENYEQRVFIHGIGIVVTLDDKYAKVYWIHAKQFLWVLAAKLTTFRNLKPKY